MVILSCKFTAFNKRRKPISIRNSQRASTQRQQGFMPKAFSRAFISQRHLFYGSSVKLVQNPTRIPPKQRESKLKRRRPSTVGEGASGAHDEAGVISSPVWLASPLSYLSPGHPSDRSTLRLAPGHSFLSVSPGFLVARSFFTKVSSSRRYLRNSSTKAAASTCSETHVKSYIQTCIDVRIVPSEEYISSTAFSFRREFHYAPKEEE